MTFGTDYMSWLERWGGLLSLVMILFSAGLSIKDFHEGFEVLIWDLLGIVCWGCFLAFWGSKIANGKWKQKWLENWMKKHGGTGP